MTVIRERLGRGPRRARMLAGGLVLSMCSFGSDGCRRSHAPEPAPPPASSIPRGPAAVPAATQQQPEVQPAAAPPAPSTVPLAPEQPAAQPAAQPEAADQKKPRDFSIELAHMLGEVSGCVQPRAAAEAQPIDISVSTYVMPGGSVSRAEVSAGPLSRDELACVRARAESLHFAPPIENGPLEVRASVRATPKQMVAAAQNQPKMDSMGMIITQAPSGEGITPGVVPPADPGVVPPESPGVVPTPDPPAEVTPIPAPLPLENPSP